MFTIFHSVIHSIIHPYPRNWAPEGPTSMSLLARPSPSTMGGMVARRCLFTSRHVTRVGALHFLGGMIMRRPLCRQPRMAPPLASTMKLTRKLRQIRRYTQKLKTYCASANPIKRWESRHQTNLAVLTHYCSLKCISLRRMLTDRSLAIKCNC